MSKKPIKVLIICHGHPDINPGGGEIASYNLHSRLCETEGYDSMFFARHNKPDLVHGGTPFSGTGKPNEVLFFVPMGDWFKFSQPDHPKIWRDFRECLENYKPDLVHFHHYVHLGLEMIREVKNYNPNLPVVLTLHEYFGICHNHGQMVKASSGRVCHTSSPAACANCFPQYSSQDFFLRKQFIQSFFSLVDRFISPSEFLKSRYAQWGLSDRDIVVIENIDKSDPALDKQANPHNEDGFEGSGVNGIGELNKAKALRKNKIVLSYFGQINSFKGIDILIDAIALLPKSIKSNLIVNINGSGLENNSEEFRKYIQNSVKTSNGLIRLCGRYERSELQGLMKGTDWIIIPSKWWENSPMVILEAKKYAVPVIASNIGGMKEKIKEGETGLHFQMGRPDSLAQAIEFVVTNPECQEKMAVNIGKEYHSENDYKKHLTLYSNLLTACEESVDESSTSTLDEAA